MRNVPVWIDDTPIRKFPKLQRNISADVIVIGAGTRDALPDGAGLIETGHDDRELERVSHTRSVGDRAAKEVEVPAPKPEPATTSLKKCMPNKTREAATLAAQNSRTGMAGG